MKHQDPTINRLLQKIDDESRSTLRTHKMNLIKENRELRAELHDPLSTNPYFRIRPTLLFQVPRRYREEGRDLPLVSPRKDITFEPVLDNIAWEFAELKKRDGKFAQAYRKGFESFHTDGAFCLYEGYESNKLKYEVENISDIYFDSSLYSFHESPFVALRRQWTRDEAKKLGFPVETLAKGSPLDDLEDYSNDGDDRGDLDTSKKNDDLVYGLYVWDKETMTKYVILGGNKKVFEQEEFKELPLYWFELTGEKKGAYSLSSYDAIKDIAVEYATLFNMAGIFLKKEISMPLFVREVNTDRANSNYSIRFTIRP
jgi:hypothetical protein